ncbi:MAG: DUF814 domain-containing protein [Myxococcales bacterium]|nr:DUF814 domain-containing protein [Myxococcales bacterium]USN49841.1 MAG: DUF814 domain-containing protein [Myxococcales bacterium]
MSSEDIENKKSKEQLSLIEIQEQIFQKQIKKIYKEIHKKERLYRNLKQDYKKCIENIELLNDAETLKNNFFKLKKGLEHVVATDFFSDPPLDRLIKLDPKLSPQENINHLFNLVKRAKRGIQHIEPRIKKVEQEIENLKQELESFIQEGAENIDLQSITQPILRPKKKGAKRLAYRIFSSLDALPLWVGRSAKDNDEVLKFHARGNEWWLHAKEIPGSHVIIKDSSDSITLENLLDAATLAAHFSKSKDSNIEVSYTRVKWVKKLKGMSPGKVAISHAKVLLIKYDHKRLERLLESEIKPVY